MTVSQIFLVNPAAFAELNWLAGAIACAIATVVMAVTKNTHPPAGATAMFAVSQPSITALGWYYVPVIMLWATAAIAIGLVVNNIQRQYPSFWVTAKEHPDRPSTEIKPRRGHMYSLPDKLCNSINSFDSAETLFEKESVKDFVVIISGAGVTIPDSLQLKKGHRQALKEIQQLLEQRYMESRDPPKQSRQSNQGVWLQATTSEEKWCRPYSGTPIPANREIWLQATTSEDKWHKDTTRDNTDIV